MDGSQVGVLEEGDEVGLGSLLESHDSRGLEAQVGLFIKSKGKLYILYMRYEAQQTLKS